MTEKKCKYCAFGSYGGFEITAPFEDTIYALYAKKINAKQDLTRNGLHGAYDYMRLVKSNKGYFLEVNTSYEFDEDSCTNFIKISFCPIYGRELPKFDGENFADHIKRGDSEVC